MSSPVRTFRHCNLTVNIYPNEGSENPRKESDPLGVMVCFHKRYDLEDEHGYRSGDYSSWDEIAEAITRDHNVAIMLPLYLYDHSGITMSTGGVAHCDSAGWDWGQVGFIFITREQVKHEYGWTRLTTERKAKLREILESEVKTYDQWLRGDIYGYEVVDDDEYILDSCWGFYGLDYCIDEAKRAAEYEAGRIIEQEQLSVEVG